MTKYIDTFIKLNIDFNFTVESTSGFVKKLEGFQFSSGDKCVIFDACSLYTNVTLGETIVLIPDKVYSTSSAIVPPFSKKVFLNLFKFATSGMFLYNDRLYKQVDGVAIGNPLGPSLANFFPGHFIKNSVCRHIIPWIQK